MKKRNKIKKNWARPAIVSLSIKSETTKVQSNGAHEFFKNPNNPGPLPS